MAIVISGGICGRQQTIAPANAEGGVTELEAQAFGWKKTEHGWRCPFCAGSAEKLRQIFERGRA
jgi:hypothetical protein